MKTPDMVKGVGIAVEIDISSIVKSTDLPWIADKSIAVSGNMTNFLLRIPDNTDVFKGGLGEAGEAGVNQKIIDQLKRAREMGAMYVILFTENK